MRWKCDLAGKVSAMLHLLQMGPSKVHTTFPLQIQSSWQLSLLELPPCRAPTHNTLAPCSDSSDMYTSTVQSGLPSANAALPPHPRLQTSYTPSAQFVYSPSAPRHRLLLLAVLLHFLPPLTPPPDSLRVLQWNAGGLRARSTELLHFLPSQPVDLICIQESNLNSFFTADFWILCSAIRWHPLPVWHSLSRCQVS